MLPLLPSHCESAVVSRGFETLETLKPEPPPQPRPLLSLSADAQTLYVELVQVAGTAGDREMAWVRPVLFVDRDSTAKVPLKVCAIVQESDLLWPLACFAEVYAEDYLPLLPQTVDLDPATAKLILRVFVRRAWELHWPHQAA